MGTDTPSPCLVADDGLDGGNPFPAIGHKNQARTEMHGDAPLLVGGPAHIHRQNDRAQPRDRQQGHDVVGIITERDADDIAWSDANRLQMPRRLRHKRCQIRVGDRAPALDNRRVERTAARVVEYPVANVQPALRAGDRNIIAHRQLWIESSIAARATLKNYTPSFRESTKAA